jgi:hypothetical protein
VTDQSPPAVCGLPHHAYPQTRCTQPAGHTGPHAGPWIVDGRERGAAGWDTPSPDTTEGADAEAWRTDPRERLLAAPLALTRDQVETLRDVCDQLLGDAPDPEHAAPPDGLRAQYAAALHRDWHLDEQVIDEMVTALLAVRDAELDRTRSLLRSADRLRQESHEALGAATRRAEQAERSEVERDRLRAELATLRAVDERGYCPHCGRGDCTPTVDQWMRQSDRADQAEAAIARVRRLCDLTITTSVRVHAVHQARDTLAALDQPAEAPAPPPPGSTREQLPDHLLTLIQPHLPNYLSTACSTGQLLNCDLDQPHASEREAWAERMHQRCRLNHKFTGQLCCCDCHQDRAEG